MIRNSQGQNNFDARNVFGDECKGNDECRAGDDKGEMLGCQEFQYREVSESRAQVKRREGEVTSVTSSRCTLVSITAIIDPSLQFLF